MAKSPIKFSDIKNALGDQRFRETLPENLLPEVQSFLHNPGCSCNKPLYKKILTQCQDQLKNYFPSMETKEPPKNRWSVINCHVDELEGKLKTLHKYGRKHVAIARYEDQITILINDLD